MSSRLYKLLVLRVTTSRSDHSQHGWPTLHCFSSARSNGRRVERHNEPGSYVKLIYSPIFDHEGKPSFLQYAHTPGMYPRSELLRVLYGWIIMAFQRRAWLMKLRWFRFEHSRFSHTLVLLYAIRYIWRFRARKRVPQQDFIDCLLSGYMSFGLRYNLA